MPREKLPLGTYGEISCTQHPNEKWQARARYRDIDGKTRTVKRNGDTKAKAILNLKAHLTERHHTTTSALLTPSSTLRALAAIWWVEFKDKPRATNTTRRYREIIDGYLLPRIGDLKINECSPGVLTRYLKTLEAEHGYATAKLTKTVLSNMFTVATANDAAPRNPVKEISLPAPAKKPVEALDLMEAVKLRNALSGDVRAVLDVMLGTGCRISEVLALRWCDLDLADPARSFVNINGTLSHDLDGKLYRQGHPKGKQVWTKPLPEFTARALIARRDAHIPPHATTTAWATPDAYVFPSTTGTAWEPNNFRKRWRADIKAAGFSDINPHLIRKTVVTHVSRNSDLVTASLTAGHSDTDVTARHYVKKENMAPDTRAILEAFGMQLQG